MKGKGRGSGAEDEDRGSEDPRHTGAGDGERDEVKGKGGEVVLKTKIAGQKTRVTLAPVTASGMARDGLGP